MTGNNTDACTGGTSYESARGGVSAQRFQRPENDGVVCDDKIVPSGTGQVHKGTGRVKRQQNTVHGLLRIADQQADIVPVFGQVFRSYVLQDIEKILDDRHSVLLYKEKEVHPLGDVPLFRHSFQCPSVVSAIVVGNRSTHSKSVGAIEGGMRKASG